jgi:hypothetical protein
MEEAAAAVVQEEIEVTLISDESKLNLKSF